jgi:hypothetical protein
LERAVDDGEYDRNKRPDKTYISPRLIDFDGSGRPVRIATKTFVPTTEPAFALVKGESVIRYREGGTRVITAKFFEASFALTGGEIATFLDFAKNIQEHIFKHEHGINIEDEELRRFIRSEQEAVQALSLYPDALAEALRTQVTKEDLVAVAYRRKQLAVFKKLLTEPDYFEKIKAAKACVDEALWQQFFEKNTWIFGYGLGYLFLSALDDRKLESVVRGHSVASPGKRADALMKTRGLISNLCFVEIKTHTTKLLSNSAYRAGCWSPSTHLAGAVAQVQGTAHSAAEEIGRRFVGRDKSGAPTGEEAFNFEPRSFLIVGSLDEFIGEHGVNEEQYRSFELYRRNTARPEILTFDELYERASYIVDHAGAVDEELEEEANNADHGHLGQ